MKISSFYRKVSLLTVIQIILFCLSSFAAGTVIDQPSPHDYSLLDGGYIQPSGDLSLDGAQLLAMADTTGTAAGGEIADVEPASGLDLGSWHKYLGFGTVVMAGVTAASNSNESFHETSAYITAAGALSTLLTGYMAHGEQFDMSEGIFSEPNRHIILGTLGAVLLTSAVVMAANDDDSNHSGLGVSGGVLMTLAVIDIKW